MKRFYLCLNCEKLVRQNKNEHKLNALCPHCKIGKTVNLRTAWKKFYDEADVTTVIEKKNIAKCIVIFILLLIGTIGIITQGIIPSMKYNSAIKLYEEKNYKEAQSIFENLRFYGDSEELIKECIYQQALLLEDDGNTLDAYAMFNSINGYKNSKEKEKNISNSQAYLSKTIEQGSEGDVIRFGEFNGQNINWIILKKNENQALVISENVLVDKKYNDTYESTTWEKCSIRKWLNKSFIENCFSKEQRKMFSSSKLENLNNSEFNTNGGKQTEDTFFLLSEEEFEKYLTTEQKKARSVDGQEKYYWLRTPGLSNLEAIRIRPNGEISKSGNGITFPDGVRPCVWISY